MTSKTTQQVFMSGYVFASIIHEAAKAPSDTVSGTFYCFSLILRSRYTPTVWSVNFKVIFEIHASEYWGVTMTFHWSPYKISRY